MTQVLCDTTCVGRQHNGRVTVCSFAGCDVPLRLTQRPPSRRARGCLCCCLAGSCTTDSFSKLSCCATSGRPCQHQCRMTTGVMEAPRIDDVMPLQSNNGPTTWQLQSCSGRAAAAIYEAPVQPVFAVPTVPHRPQQGPYGALLVSRPRCAPQHEGLTGVHRPDGSRPAA